MKWVELAVLLCGVSIAGCTTISPSSTLPTETATAVAIHTPQNRLVFPTPPLGWSIYSRSTYQIALPDSWQEIELDEMGVKRALEQAQNNNPPLSDLLRALLDTGQYKTLVFYAVENVNSPVLRNVAVARLPMEGGDDIETVARAYASALPTTIKSAKVTHVQAPMRVNGIDSAEIVYEVAIVDSKGNLVTLLGLQTLFLLDSGDAYVVTVTGDAADKEFLGLARDIARSFVGVSP